MEVTRIAGQEEKQIKNVAAYARVSTPQEEQELSSFNRNSGMVLNMMATVAGHESRFISKNIRWALEKQAE